MLPSLSLAPGGPSRGALGPHIPWGHWGPVSCVTLGTPSLGSSTQIPTPRLGGGPAGSGFGCWGGSLHGDRAPMTTVAMARLHGPARCHGDAPGTMSRHGDGRGMERSPWRGPRARPRDCRGSPGPTPPNTPPVGPRAFPAWGQCHRVPPRAAAAQVHLHEAFPLQFTPPSDKPNFSFSE